MNNYVGHKGGQSILPQLLQVIPASLQYYSFFFGSGGLELSKPFKNVKWVVAEKDYIMRSKITAPGFVVFSDYKDLVANSNFIGHDFIFCDPPYLFETRKNQKGYYKHEFDYQEHVAFLNCIRSINARILITHPSCDLYDTYLRHWHKISFSYMTRGGWFQDCMYLNYLHSSVDLLTYEFLGNNRTERQMIKRKRQSLVSKFNNLSYHEQKAFLKKISCSRK